MHPKQPTIMTRPPHNNITRLFKSAINGFWMDVLQAKRGGKL